MRTLILVSALAMTLAACSGAAEDNKTGTDIAIDLKTDEGAPVMARADGKTGDITIDIPGFKANIAMPKIELDADNFDISGVKLYPGSKIISMKIDQKDAQTDETKVEVQFDAPAPPDVVKGWFMEKFAAESGVTVAASADSIAGKTEDGDPFAISLKPGSAGNSMGTVSITSR